MKFEIEVKNYSDMGLPQKTIDAENEEEAVNMYVKLTCRSLEKNGNVGAILNIPGQPNNIIMPPHYQFLDNEFIFYSGIVNITYI